MTADLIVSLFLSVKELQLRLADISVEEEGHYFQVGHHFRMSYDLIRDFTEDDKDLYAQSWPVLCLCTGILTFEYFVDRYDVKSMRIYHKVVVRFQELFEIQQWECDGDMLMGFPSERQFISYLRSAL